MIHTYTIKGMTCNGCAAGVTKKLSAVDGVLDVQVDLQREIAQLLSKKGIPLVQLQKALPEKYTIYHTANAADNETSVSAEKPSKLVQLKPLLLIFAYLFTAVFLMHYKTGDLSAAMMDFMGLFYLVFSFFKLLDLKGFPESFAMYDPLAGRLPWYGRIYPFLELTLGILFLLREQVFWALVATLLLLVPTTYGVVKSLLIKKDIRCACLGTALKLPMTEATLIENAVMLFMACYMLYQYIF